MTSWTRQDEKALNCYIRKNLDDNGEINWEDVARYLPSRSVTECKCKFYRMLGQPGWTFELHKKPRISASDIEKLTAIMAML